MDSFRHSHSLGQNFLTDTNLLSAIVADAGVGPDDTVVEVGAGQGALTRPLAATGARVYAYEIDGRLVEYLEPLTTEFPNLEVIMGDFMKAAMPTNGGYKAVANLPYYITTPVLFRFLDDPACASVTVMVQKEVADRIAAAPGGKDYGVLSVSAQLAGTPVITRIVNRRMFSPPPNVDSAVVRITKRGFSADGKTKAVVRAAFSMRRKTLVNCLVSSGYARQTVLDALDALGLAADVRGERLFPAQFVELAKLI